jgi:outer membrane protein, heavy metal efflux system
MKFKPWCPSLACVLLWPTAAALAQPALDPARSDLSQSTTSLTLPELVSTVLVNNPTLQIARREREQATAGIETAGALPNPRLELSEGRLYPAASAGASGKANGWEVSQLIENPSLRSARIDAAQHGLRSSEAQVGLTRGEIVAQVRERAYEYLLRIEEAQAAGEALVLLEQTRERVRLRVGSGESARYEIIKADAEFISARQRQQSAQLAVEQMRIRLNQLAAGQLPPGWSLRASLGDALPALERDRLREQVLANNPELIGLRAAVERQQARVREAAASRWPGVELRYTEWREPDNRLGVLGASIQIPLWDQRRGPRAESEAELMRARTRLDGRQVELLLQLDSAWAALDMARLRVDALGSGAVREAEAALRVAEAAYRFGERGILDVLDAQRVLRAVRADLLQARFQLQAAAIEIDVLTGRDAAQP